MPRAARNRKQHPRSLKVDPDFCACDTKPGDELYPNGIFEFNISKLLEDIETYPEAFSLVEIKLSDYPGDFSVINEAHIESVDITRPIILAEIAPGYFNIIDGNHRAEKARRSKVVTLSAYRLLPEQHMKYLTSQRSYTAYVEYWNEKLKQYPQLSPLN